MLNSFFKSDILSEEPILLIKISLRCLDNPFKKLKLIYEQNWIPITPQAMELETKFPQILIKGVQEMKELAEKQ